MLSPYTPNPADRENPALAEALASDAKAEALYQIRKDAGDWVSINVADPAEVLGKLLNIIAQSDADWQKAGGGSIRTVDFGTHQSMIMWKIRELVGKEIPELEDL